MPILILCTVLEIGAIIACVPFARDWCGGGWLEWARTHNGLGPQRRYPDAYAAAFLPMMVGCAFFFGGGLMLMWPDHLGIGSGAFSAVAGVFAMIGLVGWSAAGCVYLFMWPAFLVPPPLRHAPGVLRQPQHEDVEG